MKGLTPEELALLKRLDRLARLLYSSGSGRPRPTGWPGCWTSAS